MQSCHVCLNPAHLFQIHVVSQLPTLPSEQVEAGDWSDLYILKLSEDIVKGDVHDVGAIRTPILLLVVELLCENAQTFLQDWTVLREVHECVIHFKVDFGFPLVVDGVFPLIVFLSVGVILTV